MANNIYQSYYQLQRQVLTNRRSAMQTVEALVAWLTIALLAASVCGVGYLFYLLFLKELMKIS